MSTMEQIRKSSRLVLYGIAFRVLGELARQAGDGAARPAPGRQETRQAEPPSDRTAAKQAVLDAIGPDAGPLSPVRADADAGR